MQDKTLYENVEHKIDYKTGEIIESVKRKIVKKEKTPEFVMLFIEGVDKMTHANLSQSESKVLAQLLKYTIKNSNLLFINKKTKELISNITKLKFNTVDQKIRILVKKGMIIKENGLYYLNPEIFGKGDFNEVKKLRHNLQIEYDFDKLQATVTTKTSVQYNEEENLQVIDVKEQAKDKEKEQIIVTEGIGDKIKTNSKIKSGNLLLNAKSFKIENDAINSATQNDELRKIAYNNLLD